MKHTPLTLKFLLLCLLFIAVSLGAIQMGSQPVSISLLFESVESSAGRILWQHRMPHIIGAIIVGASLALSGNYMQVIFRNPLAGPSVLG
ncbi:MAG: iron chelate uptake ABC transporter family permease subunit, partial [Flavobacteriales bacterium]